MSKGIHNSSSGSALTQPNTGALAQSTDGKDTLLYPSPDGSHPVASGFAQENTPAGT